ncbi:tetratricopeptide repeat-containing sensor histidine kinase [Flavobacterium sp. PLA-1-15]|uniref:tetratricopeptide repeat-containing sensor histidine kinase n=1 Tax=Flavobacterium sp. PLA-1-15 TaxID=3380533 RepID=UPI003B7810FE
MLTVKINILKIIPLLLLLTGGLCFAQNTNNKKVEEYIGEGRNNGALKILDSLEAQKPPKNQLAQIYLYKAKAYDNENSSNQAFELYIQSKKAFLAVDSIDKAMSINLDIAYLLSMQQNNQKSAESYIKEYLAFTKKNNKSSLTAKGYSSWASLLINDNPEQSLKYFREAMRYNSQVKDEKIYSQIYSNLAVLFNEKLHQPDSALVYIERSTQIAKKNNNINDLCLNLINKAGCYYYKEEFQKAIALLNEANTIKITKNSKNIKSYINNFLSLNYEALGDHKSAYKYLSEYVTVQEELDLEKQNIKILDFHTKYKSQEKEIENLNLKNKLQTNKIIVYAFIGLLLVILTIGILAYKNISKKKKIAEQEKLIETQKLEKTLKDQELRDIDLMLESQEKERQQIANELHDELGSMLATLKLNFQNLKRNANSEKNEINLFDKTDNLIEEAYQKVRNISHLKNLGVVGSQGLLVAVKKMAEKMSVLDRLKINVIPFGLTERLDNQTEVSLFRMIQELCTNIIKHSAANEVNIYLTQPNPKEINIIIEDNGNGFDTKKVKPKSGIGLKNIEKKVEQMGGTFTIDSIPTKGTTIIIDLPL